CVSVASSADGTRPLAADQGGRIDASSDSGTNWVARDGNRNWGAVAASADGNKLVAVDNGGQIYNSAQNPVMGAQGSIFQLQYGGNGTWQPLNQLDAAFLSADQTFTGLNTFSNGLFWGAGSQLRADGSVELGNSHA